MPRRLEQSIILFFIAMCISWSLCAHHPGSARFSLPVSLILSSSEVRTTHVDVGTGLSFDWAFALYEKWFFGPGLSVLASFPFANGNQMVSIKPYSVVGELRFFTGLNISRTNYAITPYLALGTQAGGLIVAKKVSSTKANNSDLMYGAALNIGATYWIYSTGLGLGYGIIMGNQGVRHKIELSAHYAFSLY